VIVTAQQRAGCRNTLPTPPLPSPRADRLRFNTRLRTTQHRVAPFAEQGMHLKLPNTKRSPETGPRQPRMGRGQHARSPPHPSHRRGPAPLTSASPADFDGRHDRGIGSSSMEHSIVHNKKARTLHHTPPRCVVRSP
jgi:hypothetical protein